MILETNFMADVPSLLRVDCTRACQAPLPDQGCVPAVLRAVGDKIGQPLHHRGVGEGRVLGSGREAGAAIAVEACLVPAPPSLLAEHTIRKLSVFHGNKQTVTAMSGMQSTASGPCRNAVAAMCISATYDLQGCALPC